MKLITWVDSEGCLDTECNAVGNRTWDSRAVYCSEKCLIADGHKHTPMGEDDSHERLWGFEPDCCEHCASCNTKVIQGINCMCECDDECIAILEGEEKE